MTKVFSIKFVFILLLVFQSSCIWESGVANRRRTTLDSSPVQNDPVVDNFDDGNVDVDDKNDSIGNEQDDLFTQESTFEEGVFQNVDGMNDYSSIQIVGDDENVPTFVDNNTINDIDPETTSVSLGNESIVAEVITDDDIDIDFDDRSCQFKFITTDTISGKSITGEVITSSPLNSSGELISAGCASVPYLLCGANRFEVEMNSNSKTICAFGVISGSGGEEYQFRFDFLTDIECDISEFCFVGREVTVKRTGQKKFQLDFIRHHRLYVGIFQTVTYSQRYIAENQYVIEPAYHNYESRYSYADFYIGNILRQPVPDYIKKGLE